MGKHRQTEDKKVAEKLTPAPPVTCVLSCSLLKKIEMRERSSRCLALGAVAVAEGGRRGGTSAPRLLLVQHCTTSHREKRNINKSGSEGRVIRKTVISASARGVSA